MSKTVREVMTTNPHTIGREQTLSAALARMDKESVRHLPVLHGGKLEGILSLTDVQRIQAIDRLSLDEVTVEDAMTQESYCVEPDTSLADVVSHMSKHGIGSAIVLDHGKPVGIFTASDAVRLLAMLL